MEVEAFGSQYQYCVNTSHPELSPLMVSSNTCLHILAVTAVLDSMVGLQLISIWMAKIHRVRLWFVFINKWMLRIGGGGLPARV